MKKKFRVFYTWHSGECLGAYDDRMREVEIEMDNFEKWKEDFEDDYMDGSYRTIQRMEEIKKWN